MAPTAPPGPASALARIAEIQQSARPSAQPAPAAAEPGFALPAAPTQALSRTALGLDPGSTTTSGVAGGTATFAGLPGAALPSAGGATVHPLNGRGELIGTPHAGTHTLGNWQSDNALDWRVPEGTPVYAVEDGVIGPNIGPLGSSASRFAGERLTLEAPGNAYYYAHLSQIVVGAGQPVVKGQLLGYTGSANGVPHLHFGQREGDPRDTFVGHDHS